MGSNLFLRFRLHAVGVALGGRRREFCSAIRPEFWRIEASILGGHVGVGSSKPPFEFSRPCPKRWLS